MAPSSRRSRKSARKAPGSRKAKAAEAAVVAAPAPDRTLRQGVFWGLIASWLLVLLALLSLPNGELLVSNWDRLSHLPFFPLLIAGFCGMVFFFRQVPEGAPGQDVPALVSRPLFFVLLILGAALRLHDIHRISGCIDNDHWIYANEALQIMDAGDRPILLPYGMREPFFEYFAAFVWSFIPQATAIVAMTIACVIVDVFILWSFYLLGKEVGGRRMGLILMGMGTISKTLIQISKIDFGFHTDVLACALAVLFLFRLLKNPKLSHFVEWGLALVLGSYIYVAFRLWTPVIIGGLWLWILWRPETRPKSRSAWALAWAVMAGWTFAFSYVNQVVPHEWALVRFFAESWGVWLIIAGLAALYFWHFREDGGKDWVFKWATGALLTALLLAPLWVQPGYSDHANETVIFHPRYGLTRLEAWKYVLDNFWNGFRLLFGFDPNNPFWNLPPMRGDSYMDYFIPAFGTVALAAFAARPRLIQASILGLFFVGYASFFLTHGAHSNRLMAALLPMYLTAGWGGWRLWQVFRSSSLKRGGAWGTALLVLFAAWMLSANVRILARWMDMRWPDTLAQDVMNLVPQDRIYLIPSGGYFGETAWDLVCEGRDAHSFLPNNPIDLTEGERGKDVAVLIAGADQASHDKLTQAYPGGTWYQKVEDNPVVGLKWYVIPFAQITQDPADLFYVRIKPASFWWRRFYGGLGLGRGYMRYEDRTARWNDDLSLSYMGGDNTGRISGEWYLPKAGNYVFSLQTANICQLWVDGKKILQVKHAFGISLKSVRLNLSAGRHEAEIVTAFNQDHQIPEVLVRSEAEGWAKDLDELAQDGTQPQGP